MPKARYYNVGYRVFSTQDTRNAVTSGILLMRAANKPDARARAANLVHADDLCCDPRIDSYVVIDYVDVAENEEDKPDGSR